MTAWGVWAAEAAEAPGDRWAYLFRLAHRRAETTMEMLAEAVENVTLQAGVIVGLHAELTRQTAKIADLEEQLESAMQDLEELESHPQRMAS